MGVLTTPRINLSMWILVYSFSDTYYVWAACAFTDNNPVSNYKLPLNTNINNTFIQGLPRRKVKYSEILASKCFKFEYTQ